MLNQARLVARTVAAVAKRQGGRTMADHGHGYGSNVPHRMATYNDLPVPAGSWKDAYAARQRKYHMQLAFSIAFFFGTLAYIWKSDTIDLNLSPPMKNK